MSDHAKRRHALFNASSADFWMECNLWVHHKMAAEEAGEDYDKSGEAAIRGTMCHEAAEMVLNRNLDDGTPFEESVTSIAFLTDEEKDLVLVAVEAVIDLLNANDDGAGWDVETEVAVPLSHEPESDGHVDVIAHRPGLLIVADHKFGEGAVSPNSNQLRIYGANALALLSETTDIDPDMVVLLAVVQPRLHREALVRRYRAWELLKFQAHVEHVVENQRARNDRRGASSLSTCEWCPFKRRCDHHTTLVGGMFSKMVKPPKGGLTDEQIEEIVRSRSALRKVIEEATLSVVENEARFPNWTRVQVQNPRTWTAIIDQEKLEEQLLDAGAEDIYSLRTPAQVRDRNKALAKLVESLTDSNGFHVRLYEGAPSGAPKEEPPKRPLVRGRGKKQ